MSQDILSRPGGAYALWVSSCRADMDDIIGLIDKLHCRAALHKDDMETHETARDLRRAVACLRERAM